MIDYDNNDNDDQLEFDVMNLLEKLDQAQCMDELSEFSTNILYTFKKRFGGKEFIDNTDETEVVNYLIDCVEHEINYNQNKYFKLIKTIKSKYNWTLITGLIYGTMKG